MLLEMARGWTGGDYSNVVAKFAEAFYYSDSLNYSFYDRESLLRFFEDDEGMPQSCAFHAVVFDENRQIGCAEYTYKGSFLYHGTVWIDIENDKIARWREYQHRSDKSREEFWNNERDRS
jgi:hypothetical protein